MDTLRRRIVGPGPGLGLAAVLTVLSWGPTPARGQMFGYGMPGYGGYGMAGYGGFGYGYPGFGYGGYGMGGFGGFGYGYPGLGFGGFGFGSPAVGYGFGGGLGYPVGLPTPAYGYYGGPFGYGISGPGAFNPLFGMGLTPLGVQSAQAERYLLGRGLTGSTRTYPAPATNTTTGAVRP